MRERGMWISRVMRDAPYQNRWRASPNRARHGPPRQAGVISRARLRLQGAGVKRSRSWSRLWFSSRRVCRQGGGGAVLRDGGDDNAGGAPVSAKTTRLLAHIRLARVESPAPWLKRTIATTKRRTRRPK